MSSKTTLKPVASVAAAPRAIGAEISASLQLDQFIPYRLAVLAHLVSRAVALRYENEFDLTIPEWRVMALLAQDPGLTAREVADATPMDKVAISRAVRRLVQHGRVQAQADKVDGRRQLLELTSKGLHVYRRVAPRALELEAQLLKDLGPRDRRDLLRLIDALDRSVSTLAGGD